MRIRDEDDDGGNRIDVTPMVDVVFQLLIFFMVATTFLDPERQIEVDLPPAQSGAGAEDGALAVSVLADGSLRLGERAVDEAGLRTALEQAARRDPKTRVTIRGDRAARHERVVLVMDACGAAGLTDLAVGTLESGGG